MTIQQADAIKFLELLLSECSMECEINGRDGDHKWRKCRRCLAMAQLEGHHKLARSFVEHAVTALKDAGAAALSRQREDANVAKARHAFSQELALTVLMLDSTDKMEAALRVLNPLLDALILAVQQSAALSPPARQLVEALDCIGNIINDAPYRGEERDGAWQAFLENRKIVESAALVPQGCKTCATCRHLRQETPMNKPPYGAICTHPMESHPMHWQETIETFGCIFHTPVPPLSPDPPQEK